MNEGFHIDDRAFREFIASTLEMLAEQPNPPINDHLGPSDVVRAWPWVNSGVEPGRVEDELAWLFYAVNMHASYAIKQPPALNRRALIVEAVHAPDHGLSVALSVPGVLSSGMLRVSTDPESTNEYYTADDRAAGGDVAAIRAFLDRVVDRANELLPGARLLASSGDRTP